jgi:hypothetical protein
MAYNVNHLLRVGDAKTIHDAVQGQVDDLKSATDELKSAIEIETREISISVTWDSESDGKYIAQDGTIGNAEFMHYSDLLPVASGKVYVYSFDISTAVAYGCRIHGYDADGTWVKQVAYKSDIISNTSTHTTIIDDNIRYIRISNNKSATNNRLVENLASTVSITWDAQYDGKYIGANGTVGTSVDFHCSNLLPIDYMITYAYSFVSNLQTSFATRIHGYDADGTWVKQLAYRTQESSSGTLDFVNDDVTIKYIRISNTKGLSGEILYYWVGNIIPVNIAVEQLNKQIDSVIGSQWYGKKWYAYGTSITNISSEGKYPTYLAQMSGLVLTNKGISGGGIGNLGAYSTGQVYSAICNTADGKTSADLITLETGANDCNADVPLGTIYDTGTETLAGCLNDCIRYLQANTNAQICIFNSPATTTEPNAESQYYEWAEMVERICHLNRVHFLRNDNNMGYAKLTSESGSMYVVDTIHQTNLGGYIMAQNLWNQLRNIPLFLTEMPS